MKLSQLISVLETNTEAAALSDKEITGLAYDSRKVEAGYIFVAIPGENFDGHDFIPQALEKGAAAIVCQRQTDTHGVPCIIVKDCRRALAALSAEFYGHPDQRLRLIGVTGTNGKTTTTNLIKWLLEAAGHKVGLVGTIRNLAGDKELPATHTTPESLELFRLFAMMEQEGCDYLVIEASSHALAQGRVSSCHFRGAVFTNLTQDHLDYHGTIEEYCRCKAQLFSMAGEWCASNGDDAHSHVFEEHCPQEKCFVYGSAADADLRLLDYSSDPRGMNFTLLYQGKEYKVQIPLIGKFNIYNTMSAISAALAEGMEMEQIIAAMAKAPQVAGRFELIDEGQDFTVVVDYAHTPDGLKNLLAAAVRLDPARLIALFGCGGNRDRGKRPIMGRLAGAISDIAIVTSDNPRFEDPVEIIKEVEEGISGVCNNYITEPDREKAIKLAIEMAQPGDMVVLAGKGHEDYQVIGDVKHHLDDRELARKFIRSRLDK